MEPTTTTDGVGLMFASLTKHGLRIVLLAIVAMSLVLAWSLNQPRNWTTQFALVPEVEASGSSALATELGLSGATSQGPDFYAEYLRSPEAFYEIVRYKYARQAPLKDSVYLADLLDIRIADSTLRFARTVKAMLAQSTAVVSRRSGLINATVSLPDPLVARVVADSLVASIRSLNDRVRKVKGRAEREFSEGRLRVARSELDAAEDSLRDFLERNRAPNPAPMLTMERFRRERVVEQKQAVMTNVVLAYESARAEEVRNTPRVSEIIPPRVPVSGDARRTVRRMMIVGVFTFGFFALLYAGADRWGGGSVVRFTTQVARQFFTAGGRASRQ